MPHFENLDKYETINPKSGKKEVIPIAPNSLNSANYRPMRRPQPNNPVASRIKEVATVEVEHVSIKQMEKEFRQAAKAAGDSIGPIPAKKIKLWLKSFLSKLLKRKKKGPARSTNRLRKRQPDDRNAPSSERAKSDSSIRRDGSNPKFKGNDRSGKYENRGSQDRNRPRKPRRPKNTQGSDSTTPPSGNNNSNNNQRGPKRPPRQKNPTNDNPEAQGNADRGPSSGNSGNRKRRNRRRPSSQNQQNSSNQQNNRTPES